MILAIIAGFLHGLKEGMVMYSAGVRLHPYGMHVYHLIAPAVYGIIILLARKVKQRGFLFYLAIILFAWEASEIGYMIARWSELPHPYENVLGFMEIHGWYVYAIHAARLIGGITLSIRGKT